MSRIKVALAMTSLALITAVGSLLVVGKAQAADVEPWKNWGAAPYARSLNEACKKAPTAINGFNMPQTVKEHFIEKLGTVCKSDKGVWLTPDMLLEQMWSGPDSHHKEPHVMDKKQVGELPVLRSPDGRPYSKGSVAETAYSFSWTFVYEGKTYILYLPLVCFNWSWAFGPAVPTPVPTPVATITPAVSVPDTTPVATCTSGFTLFAHARSLSKLPTGIRERAKLLIKVAEGRDSKFATNPAAYLGDDVSRSLYPAFSPLPNDQIDVVIGVQLLDPLTLKVVEDLGTSQITAGDGQIKLTRDQLSRAIQLVWPDNFESPPVSGYLRRLIVFPGEWDNEKGGKFFCKHATGLAP